MSGERDTGNPIVVALVSLLIPGLGHIIGGMKGRGLYWIGGWAIYLLISMVLVFVGIGIIMLFLEPVWRLGSAIDGYVQASD